ncbi:MAG: hypothetical protein Q8N47_10275 [Bryobacterales bacterium]|nr:hypothetical protein [Bryobacterales bacterium]
MTSVFIGGSRAVSRLNSAIRERLDDLIQKRCQILIGDANGADRAVQQHLAERGYRDVTVFCMDRCRNNVGDWPVRKINAHTTRRDFSYFVQKDIAMAGEAGCGFMLWDGKSKGTLHNMMNLVGAGKKVLVYFALDKRIHKLSNDQDLQTLLARCDRREIARIRSSLATLPNRSQSQLELHTQ